MHIYFSGIGGVGIGPLAEIAHDAGYTVSGSDQQDSPLTRALRQKDISLHIGQDGSHIAATHEQQPIDWFVHTSALPESHPELLYAREHGIKTSKRDELLSVIIRDKNLNLVAVSGTHGKTTTTGLIVWALKELDVPVSYSVGTELSYGPSGQYDDKSSLFVYECDEFDRNMLHFWPHTTIITSLDHDHVDTYPTKKSYQEAFVEFIERSAMTFMWERERRYLAVPDIAADYEAYDEHMDLSSFVLPGVHTRQNAFLAAKAIAHLLPEVSFDRIVAALNTFPGTGRRFEKLADNLYSDYAHHPVEIAATLQMARELNDDITVVYQPHQNVRQHQVRRDYADCMKHAGHIYWLPTYLTREPADLPVISAQELVDELTNKQNASLADLDEQLWQTIQTRRSEGSLVLVMGAGSIDGWIRQHVADNA